MNIIKTYIANQIIDFLYKTEWWYYKKKNGSKNIKSEFAFIRNLRKKFYARKFRSNKNVEFGDFTYGVPQIYSWGEGTKFKIGKFCSIASGVKILLGGNHRYDWITTYPFISFLAGGGEHCYSKGDVMIGNDVWIGCCATILSGVKVDDGAVIAAHSVVTKDVPPYSIVAGNPAKIIKKRFSDEIIHQLKIIQWWNWTDENIIGAIPLLQNNDVLAVVEYYKQHIITNS